MFSQCHRCLREINVDHIVHSVVTVLGNHLLPTYSLPDDILTSLLFYRVEQSLVPQDAGYKVNHQDR